MTRFEFGSREWMSALCSAMHDLVDSSSSSASHPSWSISERYIDAPAHLVTDDGNLGWCAKVRDGRLTFECSPSHNVGVEIRADYHSILPLARLECGNDVVRLAERDRMMSALITSGKLVLQGNPTTLPPLVATVHDVMARVTA